MSKRQRKDNLFCIFLLFVFSLSFTALCIFLNCYEPQPKATGEKKVQKKKKNNHLLHVKIEMKRVDASSFGQTHKQTRQNENNYLM